MQYKYDVDNKNCDMNIFILVTFIYRFGKVGGPERSKAQPTWGAASYHQLESGLSLTYFRKCGTHQIKRGYGLRSQ